MQLTYRRLAAVLTLALHFAPSSTAAELYTMKSTGETGWFGTDINLAGEAVGSHIGGLYYNGQYVTVVPPLGGSGHLSASTINSINNNRIMVGESTTGIVNGNTGPRRGYRFDANTGQFTELGSLGGVTGSSNARAINDSNLIVGESATTNGIHAVRFELDGSITDLGTLGGDTSSATDINDNGDIVGQAQNAEGHARAFLLSPGGAMRDLGTLGGDESRATRINNKGQVVGAATIASGEWRAFLYSDGRMQDLGTLGGDSEALGINEQGVVVGSYKLFAGGPPVAFVWYSPGPMQQLDSLVHLAPDDTLMWASAINDRGSILAVEYVGASRIGYGNTVILEPGHISGAVHEDKWEVTLAGPPGSTLSLDRSTDLQSWTTLIPATNATPQILYSEPLEQSAHFFRLRNN